MTDSILKTLKKSGEHSAVLDSQTLDLRSELETLKEISLSLQAEVHKVQVIVFCFVDIYVYVYFVNVLPYISFFFSNNSLSLLLIRTLSFSFTLLLLRNKRLSMINYFQNAKKVYPISGLKQNMQSYLQTKKSNP